MTRFLNLAASVDLSLDLSKVITEAVGKSHQEQVESVLKKIQINQKTKNCFNF